MKTLLALSVLALALTLGSARVFQVQSLSSLMTMRQTAPFRTFSEFNRRNRVPRPLDRQCLTTRFRTLSGFCNNRRDPLRGAADTGFELISRPVTPDFTSFPNPRMISNIVCDEAAPIKNSRGMSELVTFFGQLLDHTVTEIVVNKSLPVNIKVPLPDMAFKNTQFIPFFRTLTVGSGRSRAPLNRLSGYIDASSIYGVDTDVAASLRARNRGRLLTPKGLLPTRPDGSFISGDIRVDENPNLTSMHLLFTREHNKIAEQVEAAYPTLKDEGIFQLARHILIAEFQAIVFFEFLPALTGRNLPAYVRYNEDERTGVSNSFSTVAFRVGHTLLNRTVNSISASGRVRNRLLRNSFFNPDAFREDTIDGLLRGMMTGFASEVDAGITGEVRNFLVDETSPMQLDLAALNIQRGRDHGVPRYNALRTFFGLRRLTRFDQITSDTNLQIKLERAYGGDINAIDAWVGGISEDREVGSFGPLFARIWLREFRRFRDGDRFYFERPGLFTDDEIARIPILARVVGPNRNLRGIMRDVIVRNTEIPAAQVKQNPFFV